MSSRTSMPLPIHENSGMVDVSAWLGAARRSLAPLPPLAPARPGASPSRLPTLLGAAALVLAAAALAIALASARGGWAAEASTPTRQATAPDPDPTPDATSAAAPAVQHDADRRSLDDAASVDDAPSPAPAEPAGDATDSAPQARAATPRGTRRVTPTETLRRSFDSAVAGTDEPPEEAPADSIDALLDRALAGRSQGEATDRSGASETLPETPSRETVLGVLRGLSDEVAQCREQGMEPTVVTTHITIDGATGHVARATVDGELAWTTAGACVGRTLDQARFPRFARDRFEVQFPYRL